MVLDSSTRSILGSIEVNLVSVGFLSPNITVPKPFAKLNRFEEAMLERLDEEAQMPAELEAAINHRLSVGISAEQVIIFCH